MVVPGLGAVQSYCLVEEAVVGGQISHGTLVVEQEVFVLHQKFILVEADVIVLAERRGEVDRSRNEVESLACDIALRIVHSNLKSVALANFLFLEIVPGVFS